MSPKPKFAMYWTGSCGGCEVSLFDLQEGLLALAETWEIVCWPMFMDGKKEAIARLGDREIDIALVSGAVRTTEHEEMVRLLRAKSGVLVAYGACACSGGIPALADLSSSASLLKTVYCDHEATENPAGLVPQAKTRVPEGAVALPILCERVRSLGAIATVDYFLPGCPPEPAQVRAAVERLRRPEARPAPGTFLGGGDRALCEECPRRREGKKVRRFFRAHELEPAPGLCLLEQGLLCLGPATRSGCGCRCVRNDMPCIGCYGPPPGIEDQGAMMLAAVASILEPPATAGESAELEREIAGRLAAIVDPAGTFYTFSLARPGLPGKRMP